MKLYKNLSTALKERKEVSALKLSLKDNRFPEELFDFPNLTEIYLEGNVESFPSIIEGWKKVKIVSLKWEKFSGSISPIFHLPCLENLKIIETPLKQLLLPVGHATSPMKFLTIKSCVLYKLPEEISMLESLQELYLPNNELTQLPYSFAELKSLRRLNLDQNKFVCFPEVFKKMPGLTHLSIDGNFFSEEEKEKIQRDFNIWIN